MVKNEAEVSLAGVFMAVRFIVGRSGTGKTRYCIDAVVDALWGRDEQPLVFLVPEQASYQAERAILGDERLAGCSFFLGARARPGRVFRASGGR